VEAKATGGTKMSTGPERALGRKELGAVIGSAMDAIVAIDEAQRIVLFNEAAAKMFGCPGEEALGSHIERFVPPDSREEHREHVKRFAREGTTNRRMGALGNVRGLRANGKEFPIEASISQVASGPRMLLVAVLRDVEERRRLEESLQRERGFARELLNTAHAVILVLDPSGRIVQYNRFMRELCGYELEEVRGRDWFETFVPAAERERLAEGFPASGLGSVSHIELRDGSTRAIRWWDAEIRDEDGALEGLLCLGHDITEQRVARRDAEFLSAIIASSSDAIFSRARDGTILTWNRAAEEILGYSAAEMVGRSPEAIFPQGVKAKSDELFRRVLGGEIVRRLEVTRVRKNGTTVDLSVSKSPVRDADGKVVAMAVMAHDISEEKRARQAEASLSEIIDQSLNEIYVCDARTLRFLAVNLGARENLGFSLEEMLQLTVLDVKSELSGEQFEELLEPLRSGHRVKVEFETAHRRKDGSLYPVEVHVQRGRYQGSDALVAIVLDITERKAAAQRELEAERRARKLEALASISTLTAGIAHDIGAPMTAILGYAEMMEKSLPDEKNRRRAQIIIEQIQRTSHLVQALLNMARPGECDFISLDVGDVLQTSLEFYREKLRKHGVAIERSFEPVPAVAGDPNRLQQVFLNLITNALDAMPNGGTLWISLSHPEAEVVEVGIRDSGSGMDSEMADQIFEPFFTTKKRGQGTGLGLVVARGIIHEHDGEIAVRSEVGAGTEFVIRFPSAVAEGSDAC